ncbi:FACT complex subunit SPT16 [Fusarium oxysporum f. sp. albedinis]|nr:FACT complex subunit SPT16 [Fusarium oxysporum f. sp. albedinis]
MLTSERVYLECYGSRLTDTCGGPMPDDGCPYRLFNMIRYSLEFELRLLLTGDNLVPCNSSARTSSKGLGLGSVRMVRYLANPLRIPAEFERFGQGAEARSGAAEAKPPKRGLTRILRNPCTNPGFQAASRSKSGDRADVP